LREEKSMKIKLGAKNCLYPLPTTLVGANVNEKPNYITIAHVGIMNLSSVSLGMHKSHYTNIGIRENRTFSINFPSVKMVKETDYCGIFSGKKVDKTKLFDTFYGTLVTAPMIKECPLNMECQLIKTVDFPDHDVFVGEVVETYVEETCLTNEIVDFAKIQPILFVMNDRSYWKLGERFATAWNIGNELKNR
jgi:flavin reductase (DIM6/NTAB) family NADH-FMN oxidoreductase RutF